ncbi:MAG: hypothetical protein MUP82_10235, partial [Candidatus Marinimicrobia bacterium]|nr:hypothetical protein [Candidatus Neomarinimicrobiota bacterium]
MVPLPIVHASAITLSVSACTETTVTLTWTRSSNAHFSSYSLFFTEVATVIVGYEGHFTQIWSTTNQALTS